MLKFENYWSTLIIFFKFIFIYFERERELGRGRERERENSKQALHCQPGARSKGSNSRTVRSWPEPKTRVGCFADWATQAPQFLRFFKRYEYSNCEHRMPSRSNKNKATFKCILVKMQVLRDDERNLTEYSNSPYLKFCFCISLWRSTTVQK